MRNTKDRDDGIRRLDLSDEFLLDSAEKRYSTGDYMGALTMLNKRAGMYSPSADASALYADVYEALSLWGPCADAWFRFLDTCNEADFAEGYEGLSVAFANMGDTLRAELFYRRAYEASGETPPPSEYDDAEFVPEQRPQLRLIHSDDGTISDPELLRRGVGYVRTGELDKAKEVLSEIEPESEDFPSACGLIAAMASPGSGIPSARIALQSRRAVSTIRSRVANFVTSFSGIWVVTKATRRESADCIMAKSAVPQSSAISSV